MSAYRSLSVVAVAVFAVAAVALAAIPATLDHRGHLVHSDGTPVTAATSVRFSLYSSNPSRNNPVWQETRTVIPDSGDYAVQLGSVTPMTSPFDVPYYLGVMIAGDNEMELQPFSGLVSASGTKQVARTGSLKRIIPGMSIAPAPLPASSTTASSNLKADRADAKPTLVFVPGATSRTTALIHGATNTAGTATTTPAVPATAATPAPAPVTNEPLLAPEVLPITVPATTGVPVTTSTPVTVTTPVTSGVYNGGAPIPATIQAVSVATAADGLDPANIAWQQAPEVSVAIDLLITDTQAPKTLQPGNWRWVKVKAMHNGSDILFRFEFNDSSTDTSLAEPYLFADAFAMQIPFQSTVTTPPIEMGNQAGPVNIIFWRSTMGDPLTGMGHPQNIVAGGVGTVQKSPDSESVPISSFQKRENGFWTLVIKRPLSGGASANGNMVTFIPGIASKYKIVLANWNGANQERNGLKLVSGNWQTLWVKP